MREREELRFINRYKFALIRVRFPDGVYLQGTFSVYEKLSQVYEFVQSCLKNEDIDFKLVSPLGLKFDEDLDKTLYDLRWGLIITRSILCNRVAHHLLDFQLMQAHPKYRSHIHNDGERGNDWRQLSEGRSLDAYPTRIRPTRVIAHIRLACLMILFIDSPDNCILYIVFLHKLLFSFAKPHNIVISHYQLNANKYDCIHPTDLFHVI